VVAVDKQL
jgi:hypothetical protein